MNLGHYISQALYRYPCVIVPDFGAFVTENIPAKISENGQNITPPSKKVVFNGYITNNDGLLAQLLCVGEKCAYDVAIQKIESEVKYFKLQLAQNQSLVLDYIGEFKQIDSKLIFIQNQEKNYNVEAFGLSPIQSPHIKREVYKEDVVAFEEKVPILLTPEAKVDHHFSRKTNWFKYAAVFFLGLGALALGYFGNLWYQKDLSQKRLLSEQIAQEQVEEKLQQASFFLSEKLQPVTLKVSHDVEKTTEENEYVVTYFHVVGGAFKSVKNATKEVQALSKKGYNARIGGKNKHGYYLVLFESFINKQEAMQVLETIKATENQDAWILTKPL